MEREMLMGFVSKTKDAFKSVDTPSLIVFSIGFLIMIAQFVWFAFKGGIFEDIKNFLQ